MSNVITLDGSAVDTGPFLPPAAVVELLTEILEEAKAGKVSAVCVIAFRPDGSFTSSTATENDLTMLGALEVTKASVLERLRDGD